jgi:hypothetical protein
MADTAIISLRIIIPYAQRRDFPKFHDGTARWAIVTHQRVGKAVAVAKLIRAAAACRRVAERDRAAGDVVQRRSDPAAPLSVLRPTHRGASR